MNRSLTNYHWCLDFIGGASCWSTAFWKSKRQASVHQESCKKELGKTPPHFASGTSNSNASDETRTKRKLNWQGFLWCHIHNGLYVCLHKQWRMYQFSKSKVHISCHVRPAVQRTNLLSVQANKGQTGQTSFCLIAVGLLCETQWWRRLCLTSNRSNVNAVCWMTRWKKFYLDTRHPRKMPGYTFVL